MLKQMLIRSTPPSGNLNTSTFGITVGAFATLNVTGDIQGADVETSHMTSQYFRAHYGFSSGVRRSLKMHGGGALN